MPRKRGAVVIGVNKTGGLPVLEASVAGAEAFAQWLAAEGFEVKTITDAKRPVTPAQIAEAIESFVTPATYHQLVIYFSGHGFWKNDAELWLLTNAPADANAAVSWAETAEFAKDCGIPNVVIISDACRSIPNTPRALKVRGSIIFPNEEVQRNRAKVDKFMAAAMGASAYEVPIGLAGKKQNAFTHCFLRAFAAPDRDMIQDVNEDGHVIKVVPNRKLGKYLQREVARLLAAVNVQLNQAPDAEVLSDDDVYIGRAQSSPPPASVDLRGDVAEVQPPSAPTVHLRDVALMTFERALDKPQQIAPDEMRALEDLSQKSGFETAIFQAGTIVSNITHFETKTGFAIVGA